MKNNFSIPVPPVYIDIQLNLDQLLDITNALVFMKEVFQEDDESRVGDTFCKFLDNNILILFSFKIFAGSGNPGPFILDLHVYELDLFQSCLEMYRDVMLQDGNTIAVANLLAVEKLVAPHLQQYKSLILKFFDLDECIQQEIFERIYTGRLKEEVK